MHIGIPIIAELTFDHRMQLEFNDVGVSTITGIFVGIGIFVGGDTYVGCAATAGGNIE